jgi:hypothetical protein
MAVSVFIMFCGLSGSPCLYGLLILYFLVLRSFEDFARLWKKVCCGRVGSRTRPLGFGKATETGGAAETDAIIEKKGKGYCII